MKCHEVRALLSDEFLPAQKAAARDEHLAGCAACRAESEGLSSLVGFLRQHPPDLPGDMAFSMMGDRVWAQLEADKKKRRSWLGFFGLASATLSAVLAVVLLWPKDPAPALPPLTLAELTAALEAESVGFASLGEPIELGELDEASAARLEATLQELLPVEVEDAPGLPSPGLDLGDELEGLSPAELERLDALLTHKKKG
jgi:hypothetical protein